MPIMNTELYYALKEAGAGEEKASAAATSVAAYENRFAKIETDLSVLKWIAGTNIAITLSLGWLLLRVAAKLGVLG